MGTRLRLSLRTPKAPVKEALREGRDILFDIDWQGARQLEPDFGEHLVSIFLLPPSMAELERRLRARGTDTGEVIADRMRRAADEISHWAEYEYVLVNDEMDECLAGSARSSPPNGSKRVRQTNLVPVRPQIHWSGHTRFQQLQEPAPPPGNPCGDVERRFRLGVAPHCSSCHRSSTLTARHASSGVNAFSSTASAATSDPPIVTSGDRPAR